MVQSRMYRWPLSYTHWNTEDKFWEWFNIIFIYCTRHLLKSWRVKRTAVGMLKAQRQRTFWIHPCSWVILWWTSMISSCRRHAVLLDSSRSTEFLSITLPTSRGKTPSNWLFWSSIWRPNQSTSNPSILWSSPCVNSRSPGLSTGSTRSNSLANINSFLHLSIRNWAWKIMILLDM